MKKITLLLTALLLFVFSNANAQTLTEKYTASDYTWNTANKSRDATLVNGKLYVIENTGKIHVIDVTTGNEIVAENIENSWFNAFGITSDGEGALYVPTGNIAGGTSFKMTKVELPNTVIPINEHSNVGTGIRTDYPEAYKVDATTTYIAGPTTNHASKVVRVWTVSGTTISDPVSFEGINAQAGADVKWINESTILLTGQSSTPMIVSLNMEDGTFTKTNVGTTTYAFGGSAYFEIAGVPYAVFPTNGLGAYEIFDISDPANPVSVAENTTTIGGNANASIHVAFEAVVEGNIATIYTWSPNNGLSAFEFEVPAKTFTVTVPEGTEKVYIVGGFGEQDGPTWWNLDEPFELTPTENPNEFTGTFPCGDDIEYKYICHPGNWDYQEAVDLGSTAWDPKVDPETDPDKLVKPSIGGNRTYNEADEVKNWVAQPQVKLSVTLDPEYTGEVPTTLSVKGSWDDWGEPITLTKEGDAFVGAIGNGTDDLIYSNMEYKYIIPGETDADNNWEVRTDAEGNRWAIHPQMNDVIVNFEKEVVTGLNQINTEIALLQTSAGIVVQFNGQADIELYSINGQLIDKTRVSNTYRKDLNRGIYIIRVNGTSHKFVR